MQAARNSWRFLAPAEDSRHDYEDCLGVLLAVSYWTSQIDETAD